MDWSNPHSWIYIDVETNGTVVNWACETGAANSLIRRGWHKGDLPAGTVLLIDGWQARNGTSTANVSSVTFSDGKRLFAGSSNEIGFAEVIKMDDHGRATSAESALAVRCEL